MGQTINPLTLRLGSNLFWGFNWVSIYNRSNLRYFIGLDYQLMLLIDWILYLGRNKEIAPFWKVVFDVPRERGFWFSLFDIIKIITASVSMYSIFRDGNQLSLVFYSYLQEFWPRTFYWKTINLKKKIKTSSFI